MNATFLKRWTTWLLPLIVLRAFIPVGFMLGADQHGLRVIFCPGVTQGSGSHDPAAQGQHEHQVDVAAADHLADQESHHGGSHQQHEHVPCPYGLIGAAACAGLAYVAITHASTDESFEVPAVPLLSRSLSGVERIRGPPLFSPQALI